MSAVGPGRVRVRASGRRGSYRARLVFPKAGQWRITAQAGGATSRLGSVRVRRPPARPVVFAQPTSIDLEPAGTLLLVENNPGRVLRVNPANGRVSVLVPSIARPYAVVRAPSGSVYVSVGNQLQRLNGSGPPTTVAEVPAGVEIGPIAAGPNGDVYYSTATQIFRLPGGSGPPIRIAGTGEAGGGGDGGPALNAQFSSPHGLAVGADGALLVSDRDNNRVRRIDPATGLVTAFAAIDQPYGIDVARGRDRLRRRGLAEPRRPAQPDRHAPRLRRPGFCRPLRRRGRRRGDLRPGRGAGGLHPPHRAGRNGDDGLAPLIASAVRRGSRSRARRPALRPPLGVGHARLQAQLEEGPDIEGRSAQVDAQPVALPG